MQVRIRRLLADRPEETGIPVELYITEQATEVAVFRVATAFLRYFASNLTDFDAPTLAPGSASLPRSSLHAARSMPSVSSIGSPPPVVKDPATPWNFKRLFHADGTYDDIFYIVVPGPRATRGDARATTFTGTPGTSREMHEPVCDGRLGFAASYTFSYTSTMKRSEGRRGVFTGCSQFRSGTGSSSPTANGRSEPPASLSVESFLPRARAPVGARGTRQTGADRRRHRLDDSSIEPDCGTPGSPTPPRACARARLPLRGSRNSTRQTRVLVKDCGPRGKSDPLVDACRTADRGAVRTGSVDTTSRPHGNRGVRSLRSSSTRVSRGSRSSRSARRGRPDTSSRRPFPMATCPTRARWWRRSRAATFLRSRR